MRRGMHPKDAGLEACKRIKAKHGRETAAQQQRKSELRNQFLRLECEGRIRGSLDVSRRELRGLYGERAGDVAVRAVPARQARRLGPPAGAARSFDACRWAPSRDSGSVITVGLHYRRCSASVNRIQPLPHHHTYEKQIPTYRGLHRGPRLLRSPGSECGRKKLHRPRPARARRPRSEDDGHSKTKSNELSGSSIARPTSRKPAPFPSTE